MTHSAQLSPSRTRGQWMALLAALLGWMFDGFEMGLFPLIGPNALSELLASEIAENPAVKDQWFGVIMAMFLIGAATGGVLFGWLGDQVGRVRAMSLSILTYSLFTGVCGFATEAWHIACFRFIASLGMGGEWALGVALVTELWPDRSRAVLAGLIGAAANVGYVLVALLSLVLVSAIEGAREFANELGFAPATVDTWLSGDGWRLLMLAGALPGALTFFIRLFVPESEKWTAVRERGETSFWASRDLIGVAIGAMGAGAMVFLWSPVFEAWVRSDASGVEPWPLWASWLRISGTILGLAVTLIGYIYPVARYLGRATEQRQLASEDRAKYLRRMFLAACLAGVALLGTWGSLQWAPKWSIALARELPADGGPYHAKEFTQISLALGAIAGTVLAALAGDWLGRRVTYVVLCIASFASLTYLYQANNTYGAALLLSAFFAGGTTAAFYGWFPLYFPELFPTSIRATGQGFGFNCGRVLSAIGSLQTATLTAYFARGLPAERIETEAFPYAGTTLAGIYLVGLFIIWLGPETKGRPLPE